MKKHRKTSVGHCTQNLFVSSYSLLQTENCEGRISEKTNNSTYGFSEETSAYDYACVLLDKITEGIVRVISETMETKDPCTADHQKRVSEIATQIAVYMGLSVEQITGVRLAGMIHDIGKHFIPVDILCKPERLSLSEFEIIKTHTRFGYEVLKRIKFPCPLAKIIYQHHERVDGSGYPLGLTDKEILLESKILSVADVFDTICSNRPYRLSLGKEAALNEIMKYKGIFFDSETVEACVEVFKEDYSPPRNRMDAKVCVCEN